jgi:hypothetical protein
MLVTLEQMRHQLDQLKAKPRPSPGSRVTNPEEQFDLNEEELRMD